MKPGWDTYDAPTCEGGILAEISRGGLIQECEFHPDGETWLMIEKNGEVIFCKEVKNIDFFLNGGILNWGVETPQSWLKL